MRYPGWELDAELEEQYQELLAEGVSEEVALELTSVQADSQ